MAFVITDKTVPESKIFICLDKDTEPEENKYYECFYVSHNSFPSFTRYYLYDQVAYFNCNLVKDEEEKQRYIRNLKTSLQFFILNAKKYLDYIKN